MQGQNSRLLLTILIAPTALFGQAKPAHDQLSGTWSGYIGRSEATPSAVKIELKVSADGKYSGTVTGPRLDPGEINGGSFDAASGALKLTAIVRSKDGAGGDVTFDGRLSHDTASGKILLGGQAGVFRIIRGSGASAASVVASASQTNPAVRRSYVEVTDWITRAVDLVPAEKFSYRPVATVRAFGQLVAHVVDGSRFYCGRAAGKNVQWSDAAEKTVSGKAALVQELKKAMADCNAIYSAGGEIGPMVENVAHLSLHYGNIVTYIRMMGLTPPSS